MRSAFFINLSTRTQRVLSTVHTRTSTHVIMDVNQITPLRIASRDRGTLCASRTDVVDWINPGNGQRCVVWAAARGRSKLVGRHSNRTCVHVPPSNNAPDVALTDVRRFDSVFIASSILFKIFYFVSLFLVVAR